ncbi:LPS export ABC transporter periplasmic protein LptC [Litorimonas sp. RW-G-Af-16]|uniref:LPS export ABC transporter periplasmic protein LptC n=1 Tax=Litorimonas sp. RW-G-Af-16 TaxID=3241168 RepID=UPI00390CB166
MNSSVAPSNDHAASEALGLWEPKRTLTLEAARRHSERIKLIRLGLIGLSVALVASIGYNFATQQGSIILVDNPTESVKMVKPRYSGRTEDGAPFFVTSDTATRTLENRNEVALIKPVLEFIREVGVESSFVESATGTYDDINKVLNLTTDVNLETDDGYRCQTTHARIFAKDKRIIGDQPIACDGSFGDVKGQSYAIEDSYSIFKFKDGMSALIKQNTSDEATTVDNTSDNTSSSLFSFGGDGPVNVTADEAIYQGNTTDLEGNVEVVQGGAVLTSDVMNIVRTSEASQTAGSLKLGAIQTITAKGNFHYVTEENDIRGDQGVYEREKGLITVTGNVRVRQPGGNMVDTDRLIYNVKTEALQFSGQCRNEVTGKGCTKTGRTSFKIKQDSR